jgi:hypothetical protein
VPRLVHLAPESRRCAIERNGIRAEEAHVWDGERGVKVPRAVYAMPIVPDFSVTYQWLRELRRFHRERMVAVHFVVPSDEDVMVGRYNKPHERVPLRVAVRRVLAEPAGNELILLRGIRKNEIALVRDLTQLVGWTEVPEPGAAFDCLCAACVAPGTPDLVLRVRARFERHVLAARQASDAKGTVRELARLETPLERAKGRIRPAKLEVFVKAEDRYVRAAATSLLRYFKWSDVEALLATRLYDDFASVREAAVESMIVAGGVRRAHAHVAELSDDLLTGHVVDHLAFTREVEVAVKLLGEIATTASDEIARRVANAAMELLRDDSLTGAMRARLELLRRRAS